MYIDPIITFVGIMTIFIIPFYLLSKLYSYLSKVSSGNYDDLIGLLILLIMLVCASVYYWYYIDKMYKFAFDIIITRS